MAINLPQAATAVGALGAASSGLVDATKLVFGGVSNVGWGQIKGVMQRLLGTSSSPTKVATAPSAGLGWDDIKSTLYSNWLNGVPAADQKAIAKSFVKLHFNESTAEHFAAITGVDPQILTSVAKKVPAATALELPEADVYGRFDLALSTLIEQAYQRADQLYRNAAKVTAMIISIILALAGNSSLDPGMQLPWYQALLLGTLATPLAPVAKNLASALETAVKAVQSVRR